MAKFRKTGLFEMGLEIKSLPSISKLRGKMKRLAEKRLRRKLDAYLEILLAKAIEFAPLDTGALRRGHKIFNTGPLSGAVGFEFTSEQSDVAVKNGYPSDYFYGSLLLRGIPVGWRPKRAGVGADWLNKALIATRADRKRAFATTR